MSDPAVSTVWARAVVDELARGGLEHVCVTPGSRSAPLVMACHRDARLATWVHLDERSAAFFALGIGKAAGAPAAVLTTSGTATANLLPAVVEASRGGVPLLLLTADRPLRLRGSDANQTIDQGRIYGGYPRESFDTGDPAPDGLRTTRALASAAVARTVVPDPGPVHINLPFDKPLEPVEMDASREASLRSADPLGLDGRPGGAPMLPIQGVGAGPTPGEEDMVADFLAAARKGVIVAGPVADPEAVGPLLVRLSGAAGFPLIADPLSGARFGHDRRSLPIAHADLFLRDEAARDALRPDLILRVGRPPTSAGVLTFLRECSDVPQLVVGDGAPLKDSLSPTSRRVQGNVPFVLARAAEGCEPEAADGWKGFWKRVEGAAREAVRAAEGAFFEGDVLSAVVDAVPRGGALFVSNSMPVRDLDAFGGARSKPLRIFANRGASGIDGIVSTAAGIAAAKAPCPEDRGRRDGPPVVAVLGDLAFFHDANGLFVVGRDRLNVLFVVINNDGGGIFHMLPIRKYEPEFTRYFATPHGLDFRHLAALHGIAYRRVDGAHDLRKALARSVIEPGPGILEIRTDRGENQRRHREVAHAVAQSVRPVLERT